MSARSTKHLRVLWSENAMAVNNPPNNPLQPTLGRTMIYCPRDGNELIEHTHKLRPVWHCNACSGAFIKVLPINEYRSNGGKQPREEWDIEICCPEHLEKMDFVTVNGVTLDFCAKCGGVWLDGGEIEALLGSSYSKQVFPESSSLGSASGAWSEADFLTPLIEAALKALFHA